MSVLPPRFCWTRYGTEAGEPIERIFTRKEEERTRNDGVFLWGIGNSIAPSLQALVAESPNPEVIFSPMLSRPATRDVRPSLIAKWCVGRGIDGSHFSLPKHSLVTSRFNEKRARHFALVCRSDAPLMPRQADAFSPSSLRNLVSGAPVGASQVTSVVRYDPDRDADAGARYFVGLRARLVFPFFVSLEWPIVCVPA